MSRFWLGAVLCFATSAFGTNTFAPNTYETESISATLPSTEGNSVSDTKSLAVSLNNGAWLLSGTVTTNLPATPDGSIFSDPLDLDFVGSLTCISFAGCSGVTASFTFSAALSSFYSTLPYSVAVVGSSNMTNTSSSDVFYSGDFSFTTPTVGGVGSYNFTNSGTAVFGNSSSISETWGITVTGKSIAEGSSITFSDPGLLLGNSSPEPATFGLLSAGLGGLIWAYRKRRS
jgi:hypothetical protein